MKTILYLFSCIIKLYFLFKCIFKNYRLYNYNANNKTLNLISDSLNCKNCILKILKVQICTSEYILTTDTKGYVSFWDISTHIDNSKAKSTTCIPKYKYCLHQSGINCCDWLELENEYSLLTTGGDDQSLRLSVFHHLDSLTLLCKVSLVVHSSQVTGN